MQPAIIINRWSCEQGTPGVSMMVRLGQNLYSILTTISRCQNWCSRSNLAFSFSMYSCRHRLGLTCWSCACIHRLVHALEVIHAHVYPVKLTPTFNSSPIADSCNDHESWQIWYFAWQIWTHSLILPQRKMQAGTRHVNGIQDWFISASPLLCNLTLLHQIIHAALVCSS